MAILIRLARLLRADVHAVLDRMEEPGILLRQALREMEDEVAFGAQQLRTREFERQQVQGRIDGLEASLVQVSGQLDLCFAAENAALARTLLRRQLEGERTIAHLRQRLATLQQQILAVTTAIAEQRRALEGLRQKAELFDSEPAPFRHPADTDRWTACGVAISDADVELALLREQQRRRTS